MDLALFQRFARWAEKIAVAQRQLADEIAQELRKMEEAQDPLGKCIVESRYRYLCAARADKSKSQKGVDRELERSYVTAMNAGFKGSFALWMSLMRMGKTPEQIAQDELSVPPAARPPG